MKNPLLILLLLSLTLLTRAQNLQPTETKALMRVEVTDFEANPRPNEIITFHSKNTGREVRKVTGENGTFEILLPEGDTYEIKFRKFLEDSKYSEIAIEDKPGMMRSVLRIKYEYTLDQDEVFALDVHFFTDESRIEAESFPLLNDLAEQMQLKPALVIELAGHTDNVGSDDYNQKLSENRAAAVKKYLTDKGIAPERIQSVGYGESRPVAANDTEPGRAQNRRTEVRIVGN
ncbi:MAG: OmpA family protein [Bacteroidia bacterium]|nr:OmpA family protein [Bacteroidia bacterium]